MTAVITLDVSELEPPRPMQEICQILTNLHQGQLLHVKHRREPVPLFSILEQQQFDYRHTEEGEGKHHIRIWHKGDKLALNSLMRHSDATDRT